MNSIAFVVFLLACALVASPAHAAAFVMAPSVVEGSYSFDNATLWQGTVRIRFFNFRRVAQARNRASAGASSNTLVLGSAV